MVRPVLVFLDLPTNFRRHFCGAKSLAHVSTSDGEFGPSKMAACICEGTFKKLNENMSDIYMICIRFFVMLVKRFTVQVKVLCWMS